MAHVTIGIDGMSCAHCVHAVRKALDKVDGVRDAEVRIGAATVDYEPSTTDLGKIREAIEDAGYLVK